MKALKEAKPLVGTRISSGIPALDELLGHEHGDTRGGFRCPSVVLLNGQPGVGKTELLLSIRNLWGYPLLSLSDVAASGEVIAMVANGLLTRETNVLILDGVRPQITDIDALRADNRLVIIVNHTNKRSGKTMSLEHDVDAVLWLQEFKLDEVRLTATKNRFGKTGSIVRFKGLQSGWRRE